MTQDEAERAEAEAREELWNYARTDERVRGFRDAIEAYTEAVRRTERLKAEALVERLAEREPPILMTGGGEARCVHCGGFAVADGTRLYLDHAEDCPWVEARLWLDEDGE